MLKFCYQDVAEETLFVDLPDTDGLKIKAILRGSLDQPIVVMLHGRPGNADDTLTYLGARYLYEQGFASLRLFMYSYGEDTRNLFDCTLQTHVEDFETIIRYLKQKDVPKLFAAGHSYGGLTLLKSGAQLDGAVLWDPSHGLSWREHPELEQNIVRDNDMVVNKSGEGSMISGTMSQQDHAMGDTSAWAAGKGYPLKIIAAGKGVLHKHCQQYFAAASDPKSLIVIDEADHNFRSPDKVMLRLFEETASWFEEVVGA